MSVHEIARNLAKELCNCREFISLKEAETMMANNPDSKIIIDQFEKKQRALHIIQMQGQQLTDGQEKEIEELEKRMVDDPYIYNYMKAQQEFEKVLHEMNSIIREAFEKVPNDNFSK